MSNPKNTRLEHYAELLATTMDGAALGARNETELRLAVEPVIRNALMDLFGLTLQQIRSERRNAAGFLDTAYGGVVVEYEWQMDAARRAHGAEQALDYLTAERQTTRGDEMFSACVTDGRVWGFLVSDEALDSQLNLFAPVSSASAVDRFAWFPNSVPACQRFLELVGSHPKLPVSGDSLAGAFGRGSEHARRCLTMLVETLANRRLFDRADTLYAEWKRALEVAYGTLDSSAQRSYGITEEYQLSVRASLGETLFALHTYFALIARLVALEILAISVADQRSRPSQWAALSDDKLVKTLERLERGELPEGLRVTNLLDGDVFSWYLERVEGNISLLDAFRSICRALDGFAFPRLAFGAGTATDLFRELYQRLTTRELRGALGEFLTPRWLAEATIDAARTSGADFVHARILDPTCGTGTFLSPVISGRLRALRLSSSAPDSAQIQAALNSVVGIDVNPVAVVAARMNVLIALGELAQAGDIYIPIWLADSILLPEEPSRQLSYINKHPNLLGTRYVELQTSLDEPFVVPIECLDQGRLTQVASLIRGCIERNESTDSFASLLDGSCAPHGPTPLVTNTEQWSNARQVLSVLYEQILTLARGGRNGVWTEIIENRFAPLFLQHFDVVIGNPPWLTFTKLPDSWRRKAAPIWHNYGLYDTPRIPGVEESTSLHTSDLAVLVIGVALDRYLRDGGTLAFVVPKTLISGDPGTRAFRTYQLDSSRDAKSHRSVHVPFAVKSIDDYSEVRPFSPDASNSPIVIVLRKGEANTVPIPGRRFLRRHAQIQIPTGSWEKIRSTFLAAEAVRWEPISTFEAAPLAWWRSNELTLRGRPSPYTYGKGFDTRGANGILFLDVRGIVKSDGRIRAANNPEAGRDRDLRDAGPHIGNIEASLVVPVVRGRDVDAFRVQPSAWLLLAHSPTERSQPLSWQELNQARGAREFLMHFRSKLRVRRPYMNFRPTDDCWWGVQGAEHMDSGFLVCVREIADSIAAAVVRTTFDETLGRSVLPAPDHKLTFFNTQDEDEAYYLAAMLNSSTIKTLSERYVNFIAISPATLRYLPIPRYDSSKTTHRELATASREAHATSGSEHRAAVGRAEGVASRIFGRN